MRPAAPVRLTGHLPGLDGVRGLAILMVMAVHFVGDAHARSFRQAVVIKAASFGVLGVDLFFVLSGFLITGLLLESKGEAHYFRNFYARRTLRIFPLYYFVLAVLFVLIPALTVPSPLLEVARQHQIWLWTYTANFYIAAVSSWTALTYVSHFWSLAIEEHFYLLWPLLVFLCSRRALERICIALIAGALALRIVLALQGMSELSISVLTPCRIDTLALGALLAILVRREGWGQAMVQRSLAAASGLAVVIVAVSAFGALTKLGLPVLHQLRGSLYAFFFGALTLVALRSGASFPAALFQRRVLRFFGKYSYGLYVYHGLLTWYFVEIQLDQRLDALVRYQHHSLVIALRFVMGVTASVVLAVLSYELMERRFLALKKWFAPGERTARPAVEPLLTRSPAPPR